MIMLELTRIRYSSERPRVASPPTKSGARFDCGMFLATAYPREFTE